MRVKISKGAMTAGIGVLMALAGEATPSEAQESATATQIETVVVTAEKRQSDVQHTAASVAVLNGSLQQDRGQQGLADIQTSVPNVTFNATSNESQLYIRGIGNTFINTGGDPGVAFYQDGAYISDQRTTNTSMYDVDRVEVLSGPQGALYGRNAVGGAINVISARPTDTVNGAVSVVLGDFGRRESEGYISAPLGIADTDVRVSYQVKGLDGYTQNLLAGQPGAPSRLDDLNSQAFRIQTLTTLPDDASLRIIFSSYREADGGPALQIVPQAGFVYPQQLVFGVVPTTTPRLENANVGSFGLDVDTLNASYVQPLGDYTLTVLANYRRGKQNFLNDCDGTNVNDCRYFNDTASSDYFGDVHIASPDAARLQWLAGVSYSQLDEVQAIDVQTTSLLSYLNPAAPPDAGWPFHFAGGGTIAARSFAVYADMRLQLNDIFAITGEARYSNTNKHSNEYQLFPFFGVALTGFKSHLDNDFAPFKVRAEAQVTPDILVYASYATANKDGAINIGASQAVPVKPEEVRSEELGLKSAFFDNALQINAALFNSNYDDLQIAQVVGTVATLANAPKSSIKGGELHIVAVPFQGLQLSANAGYLDAKFDQFSNSRVIPGLVGGPLENLAGHRLPNVPPLSLSFDASYTFSPFTGFEAWLDVQYSWHGRAYFNEFNDFTNSQAPVGTLDIAASLIPDKGPWKLYGYVHNLTDQTILTGSTVYSGLLGAEKAVSFAPPRNFGIGLSYTW
jgi:iron complex outermembrane receptor protein